MISTRRGVMAPGGAVLVERQVEICLLVEAAGRARGIPPLALVPAPGCSAAHQSDLRIRVVA